MSRILKHIVSQIGTALTVFSHGLLELNQPMASAIRNSLNVWSNNAFMVVNIGYNTTDITVIKKRRILSHNSISIAYDTFIQDIIVFMGRKHNARVDESMAKRIMDTIGSAVSELDNPPPKCNVIVPNKTTALPMRIPLSHEDIADILNFDLEKFGHIIVRILESMELKVQGEIYECGIQFWGEGTAIRGLAHKMEEITTSPCHIVLN